MPAEKWNPQTKEYAPYTLPNGATLLESDLNKTVMCASCGLPEVYGRMYTSRFIHTPAGFGYMVCEDCYSEEREAELASEKEE